MSAQPAPAQLLKSRMARTTATVARLLRPWAFCRVCGSPIAPALHGRSCHDCHSWAARIIAAHESARVRRLFAE